MRGTGSANAHSSPNRRSIFTSRSDGEAHPGDGQPKQTLAVDNWTKAAAPQDPDTGFRWGEADGTRSEMGGGGVGESRRTPTKAGHRDGRGMSHTDCWTGQAMQGPFIGRFRRVPLTMAHSDAASPRGRAPSSRWWRREGGGYASRRLHAGHDFRDTNVPLLDRADCTGGTSAGCMMFGQKRERRVALRGAEWRTGWEERGRKKSLLPEAGGIGSGLPGRAGPRPGGVVAFLPVKMLTFPWWCNQQPSRRRRARRASPCVSPPRFAIVVTFYG